MINFSNLNNYRKEQNYSSKQKLEDFHASGQGDVLHKIMMENVNGTLEKINSGVVKIPNMEIARLMYIGFFESFYFKTDKLQIAFPDGDIPDEVKDALCKEFSKNSLVLFSLIDPKIGKENISLGDAMIMERMEKILFDGITTLVDKFLRASRNM